MDSKTTNIFLVILGLAIAYFVLVPLLEHRHRHQEPCPTPCPRPEPCPEPRPCPGPGPCPKPRPRNPHLIDPFGGDKDKQATQAQLGLVQGGVIWNKVFNH